MAVGRSTLAGVTLQAVPSVKGNLDPISKDWAPPTSAEAKKRLISSAS
jgi:hypothetical protein